MTRTLLLVKHSLPEIVPGVPASQWHLSEEGRRLCLPLAEQVAAYAPLTLISSAEPKAIETAQIVAEHLGGAVQAAAGLHEHDRSQNAEWVSQAQFEASVAEFFANPPAVVYGTETAAQAYIRFAEAVRDVTVAHPQGNLAIFSHGTVITLLVAQANALEPFSLWKRLGLPSIAVLSLPGMRLREMVEDIKA